MSRKTKEYIIANPRNTQLVEDNGERPSITRITLVNKAWEHDYNRHHKKTNTKTIELKNDGLSRNHRLSDHDIKQIIIADINSQFRDNLCVSLIQDIFPWATPADEQSALAKVNTMKTAPHAQIIQLANKLYYDMANHVANISYGNDNQNRAIQEHLDLNADDNGRSQRSLTPKSKKILTGYHAAPPSLQRLISGPKIINQDTILSSQYGEGGPANKEARNFRLRSLSPVSHSLFLPFFDQLPQRAQPAAASAHAVP